MRVAIQFLGVFVTLGAASCGGAQGTQAGAGGGAGAPARAAGCAIELVRDGVPARPTRLVGHAVARCRGDAAHDDARCTRALEDQACRMGAVVIWDVQSAPIPGEGDEGVEMRAAAAVYRE